MDAGILPVKRLDHAKGRLGAELGDDGRRALAEAMFEDALELAGSAGFLQWWVVSDDAGVRAAAAAAGFAIVADPGAGLNAALEAAIDAAAAAGATSATVVPADLPLARTEDLLDLVDTGATADMVVVPSASGGGTNGLYLSPPGLVPPRFGPGSLAAHLDAASAGRHSCSILALDRMGHDVDTIADAEACVAAAGDGGGRALSLLRALLSR